MSWFRDHSHYWVYPIVYARLNKPDCDISTQSASELATLSSTQELEVKDFILSRPKPEFIVPHIVRDFIKSVESERRKLGYKRLILGGRDTWYFVPICERNHVPYIHIPELSRVVAESSAVLNLINKYEFSNEDLFIDTGFQGSVIKAVCDAGNFNMPYRLLSQKGVGKKVDRCLVPNRYPNQVFPNWSNNNSREIVIEIENLPKYWTRATYHGTSTFYQAISPLDEFIDCYYVTKCIWYGTI